MKAFGWIWMLLLFFGSLAAQPSGSASSLPDPDTSAVVIQAPPLNERYAENKGISIVYIVLASFIVLWILIDIARQYLGLKQKSPADR